MAAANASARGQRAAILASPLHELTGFYLAVDCLTSDCARERTFVVAELASFYGPQRTVSQVLRRMRCAGCWGRRRGSDPPTPPRPRPAPVVRPGGCPAQAILARHS